MRISSPCLCSMAACETTPSIERDSGTIPFLSRPEDSDAVFMPIADRTHVDGAFEMAFDPVNGILYSSNWGTGLVAIKGTP